jgi:hypothetical protein
MALRGVGKINKDLLKAYFESRGKIEKIMSREVKKRGRPKTRDHAPGSQRVMAGCQKYIITAEIEHIKMMKYIAAIKGIKIKEVFARAISEYIDRQPTNGPTGK